MRQIYYLVAIAIFTCSMLTGCSLDKVEDTAVVSGIVVEYNSKKPISGVSVSLKTIDGEIKAETNSAGYYTIDISVGGSTALLTYSKDGYFSEQRTTSFKGGGQQTLNMTLALSE